MSKKPTSRSVPSAMSLGVEHAQSAAVVRLVDEIPADIEVVIDRRRRAVVVGREHGSVEIRHVPDPRSGRMPERLLVAFVVDQEEPLILGEPSLVRVRAAAVSGPRQLDLFELVGGIDDRQRVFVGVEADLPIAIQRVRTVVDDALRFVRVAVEAEAAGRTRRDGCADIDDVQPALTRSRAGGVRESGATVDRERVGRAEARIVRGLP